MPANGEIFLAGQFTATLNSVALGIMEGDAGVPTIEIAGEAEQIRSTDKYGDSLVDAVYKGGNARATYTCLEYRSGSKTAMWPYGSWGAMGVVARLLYDMSLPLVLTVVSGTPAAAAADPSTLTASKAILQPGYGSKILFGPTLRKVPIQQVLLPYLSGGSPVWFTTS